MDQNINNYKIEKTIAIRPNRTIYEVTKDNIKYVAKLFLNIDQFIQEFYILNQLNHCGIYKIKDILIIDHKYYMIFDFYQSTLFEEINNYIVRKKLKKKWIYQLIHIINYIHSKGIVYNDLKLDNIMLDKNDNLILIDFGLARYENLPMAFNSIKNQYYPPEYENIYTSDLSKKSSDIWMLGNIFYYLELEDEELQKLIIKMKDNDPNKRPTTLDIINSDYFKKNYNTIPIYPNNINIQINENNISNIFSEIKNFNSRDLDITRKFNNLTGILPEVRIKYEKLLNIFIHGIFNSTTNFVLNFFDLFLFKISLLFISFNIYQNIPFNFISKIFYNEYSVEEIQNMVEKLLLIMNKNKEIFER